MTECFQLSLSLVEFTKITTNYFLKCSSYFSSVFGFVGGLIYYCYSTKLKRLAVEYFGQLLLHSTPLVVFDFMYYSFRLSVLLCPMI